MCQSRIKCNAGLEENEFWSVEIINFDKWKNLKEKMNIDKIRLILSSKTNQIWAY